MTWTFPASGGRAWLIKPRTRRQRIVVFAAVTAILLSELYWEIAIALVLVRPLLYKTP